MLTLTQRSNQDAVLIKYLKLIGVNIDSNDVIDELKKHPNNPSILAISDVLNWFEIPHGAYHVGVDELKEIRVPFIAAIIRNNDFVTVSNINDKIVTLSDHERSDYQIPTADFKVLYRGIVLVDEISGNITPKHKNWFDRLSAYKTSGAIFTLSLAFISLVLFNGEISTLTWQFSSLILFKTLGLIISVILLIQTIDKNNPLVQTLCGSDSKTNCNAILTSKAATVFKGLTWSEVGFFYFAGTWLVLLFASQQSGVGLTLAMLNFISLPYTVYSVNYQARIAKQWCVLCTAVQALLWLEAIPLIYSFSAKFNFSGLILIKVLCLTLAPAAVWILLKPILLKVQELKTVKQQYHSFKYNKELFDAALKEEPKYAEPAADWSIVLGNLEANTIITMISNPYCPPCAIMHSELDLYLTKLEDIQLRIVFTVDNNEHDKKTPVARHLMALNEFADKTMVKQALKDWYEQKQKSYEKWAKHYPVSLDEIKYDKLDKQKEWCAVAEIKATPTLLVNGYRLPKAYQIQDIKYMLR